MADTRRFRSERVRGSLKSYPDSMIYQTIFPWIWDLSRRVAIYSALFDVASISSVFVIPAAYSQANPTASSSAQWPLQLPGDDISSALNSLISNNFHLIHLILLEFHLIFKTRSSNHLTNLQSRLTQTNTNLNHGPPTRIQSLPPHLHRLILRLGHPGTGTGAPAHHRGVSRLHLSILRQLSPHLPLTLQHTHRHPHIPFPILSPT